MDDTMTFEQELFHSDSWSRWSYTPLCQAAADGDLDNLHKAIKYAQLNDYSLNAGFEEGYHLRKGCALTEALLQGHVGCANALIDAGANVDVSCLEPDVEHPFVAFQKVEETHASLLAYSLDKKLFERILEKGCDLEPIYSAAIDSFDLELLQQLKPYCQNQDIYLLDVDSGDDVPAAYYAACRLGNKRADDAIKVFRMVIEISGCPLVWTDRDGVIVRQSPSLIEVILDNVTDKLLLSDLGLDHLAASPLPETKNDLFA